MSAVGEFDVEGGGKGTLGLDFEAGNAVDLVGNGGDGEVAYADGLEFKFDAWFFGYNPRALYPLVDDKLKTKALCATHGIPTTELFGTISAHGELRDGLKKIVEGREAFVIKPAHGAMGNGVLSIHVSRTWSPARAGVSPDTRELGVAFAGVSWR